MTYGLYPHIDFLLQLLPTRISPLSTWQQAFPDVNILYVYGIGKCKGLEEWLQEKKSRVVLFLEDRLEAIASFLGEKETLSFLKNPQVYLKFVEHPSFWDSSLEKLAEQFPYEKIEVIAAPGYRKKKRFKTISLELKRKTVLWHALTAEALSSSLISSNVIANMRRLAHAFCINSWRDQFKSVPAFICGAGPSLKEAQAHLKQCENKGLIIAGGSAISALSHLGIKPHLNFALDPNPREYDCLKNGTNFEVPFIFCARLFPKVFELVKGPIGYFPSGQGEVSCEQFFEKEFAIQGEPLASSLGQEALSVTTFSVALAQAIGCNPIILVGVDLSFRNSEKYAEGVAVKAEETPIFAKNKEGMQVATTLKWIMESETLSEYAKKHPQTSFFNASLTGLGFKSIETKPLEAISCSATFLPLREKIATLVQESLLHIPEEKICALFSQLKKSMHTCLQCVSRILEDLEEGYLETGSQIMLEMDLREELAYRVFFKGVLGAFTRGMKQSFLFSKEKVFEKEKTLAFEKAKWTHLKTIIEHCIAAA